MRVTFNMLYLKNQRSIGNSLEKLTIANDKVNKGRNLLNPESDPVYYSSAINIQRMIDEMDQFKRNAENALTWITNEDNELQNASSLISKAKNEYAIAGINASQNETSRKALAGDVKNILDSLVDIGNANYLGRYIFAGYKTSTKPFAADEKQIKGVVTDNVQIDVVKKKTFADLKELEEGNYTVNIEKISGSYGLVKIEIVDSTGKKLFFDSNGSDESAKNGNIAKNYMVLRYKPGQIINTGVGFGIKMPDVEYGDFDSTKVSFYYVPGDDIRYHGDDGKITTKIGYSQDVTLNLTGKEVFLETNRVLKGTVFNSVNGLPITETTNFLDIDNANISPADYIELSGTDHNGFSVGIAKLWGAENVQLDMTNTTAAERTIHIEYGNYDVSIVMDERAYKDTDDVVFELNRKLEQEGLGSEIEAFADGDRVMLVTTRAGAYVRLKVTGSENNTLGFIQNPSDPPYVSTGKGRKFFIGYDEFKQLDSTTYESPLKNVHNDISFGGDVELIINGQKVVFNAPSSGSEEQNRDNAQANLNEALKKAGLATTIKAKVDIGTLGDGKFNLVLEHVNIDPDNNTYFNTKVVNTNDVQFSTPRSDTYPSYQATKKVKDFVEFIESLYDNTVDAKIDNGQLVVEDLRSGVSRMTLKINESNQGIGYPEVNKDVVLFGKYTGNVDATWSFNYDYAADELTVSSGSSTIDVINNIRTNNYDGSPIELSYGIKASFDPQIFNNNFSFNVDLKSNSSLSFGDMNIIQDGTNVNVFRTLKNLYDALNLNIPEGGIGAPSAWRDENYKSTAKPYLSGEFRGNYNDKWVYEVLMDDTVSSFYLQKELEYSVDGTQFDGSALDFTLNIKDNNGNIISHNFNMSPNNADQFVDEVNNAISNDSQLSKLGVKAILNKGKVVFRSGSGTNEISVVANDNNTASILFDNSNLKNVIIGQKEVSLDLSNYSSSEVPLTFYYTDGTTVYTKSIGIPAKAYMDNDLISTIQTQLNNNGIPITVDMNNNKLIFEPGSSYRLLGVSGDYEGTLGFYKAGDEVTVKVSSEETGELINVVTLDTANEEAYVADGVKLGFDIGALYATDSFTATVGSGISYELPVLDKAETQINESLTIVGTRQNRVDSVINFHTSFTTTNEEIKAKYLGSREVDMTDAITQLQLAQSAYEAALAATTRVLQVSILDFLR
ncbi:flagellin [Deferribacter abyssi]|uniref:flagellin n=1 Tax=Deferribacter abyssi TaxID=213806 RepID=UPI003C246F68